MDLTTWKPPEGAVEPVNAFHTLYMKLTAISDGLLSEVRATTPEGQALLHNPFFGEFLGTIAGLSNDCAKATRLLELLRKDGPGFEELWVRAFQHVEPEGTHAENPT